MNCTDKAVRSKFEDLTVSVCVATSEPVIIAVVSEVLTRVFLILLSLSLFHALSTTSEMFFNVELHVSTGNGHHQIHSNCIPSYCASSIQIIVGMCI